ncbi:hypothetical protein [Brevibacterium sediminis]|uniref:hypothetical protein n=1 Tax=Brevibacterium sediminis TaxID=1857024 RepID=UPI003B3AAF9A
MNTSLIPDAAVRRETHSIAGPTKSNEAVAFGELLVAYVPPLSFGDDAVVQVPV